MFTTSSAPGRADSVWVNTSFDVHTGRIQFVYVTPGVQAVLIDLALEETAPGTSTVVTVRYRRTALDASVNDRIVELGRADAASGPEWEEAVNAALARGPAAG